MSHKRFLSRTSRGLNSDLAEKRGRQRDALARAIGSSYVRPAVERLEGRVFLNGATNYRPPSHFLMNDGGYLSEASHAAPLQIAKDFLGTHANRLGATRADLAALRVTDQYKDADTGVTHIYLRQTVAGLDVANTNVSINIARDGRVLNAGGEIVSHLAEQAQANAGMVRRLTAQQALTAGAQALGLCQGLWRGSTKRPSVSSGCLVGRNSGQAPVSGHRSGT